MSYYLFMPKRAQMDYTRPQSAYKTRREPSTYNRTTRDEDIANSAMLKKGNDCGWFESLKPKSPRREVKKRATPKKINPKLGVWKIDEPISLVTYANSEYTVEPSKIFPDMYIWQINARNWYTNVWKKTSTLVTIKQLAKKLMQLNKHRGLTRYKLIEAYEDYKGTMTYITVLPDEELKARKEAKRLEREKFAEPFFNWLSN